MREMIWPVLTSALAIFLLRFFLQVPRFPDVSNQERAVSHAGSVPARKCTCAARPGIFSATIFYNGSCTEIVF